MLRDVIGKRVLLLQGPNGPFFSLFAKELRARGCEVTKVNFSAGDDVFYRDPDVVRFRGRPEERPAFFRALMKECQIDVVFLFGDCKPIHRDAIRVAEELGVDVRVLEEGYLRPDWVTIERGGVNGYSRLPKDPEFYRRATAGLPPLPKPVPVGNTFRRHAWLATLHAVAVTFLGWRYPHYRHHRDVNAPRQAFLWVWGGIRKLWYAFRERRILERLVREHSSRYFLLPLQVRHDAQIQHSRYARMEEFIEEVVAAFAAHAPKDLLLVVKHHPHDRAYGDYRRTLHDLGRRHGCADRIVYVHDLHLPTLLKHARGVVTMNSTVGTSALHHGAPVKVLGTAVYDIPGLTSQKPLAEFFVDPGRIDEDLLACFVRWLREDNQVNGSFYKRVRELGPCGLDPAIFEKPAPHAVVQPTTARPPSPGEAACPPGSAD